MVSHSNNEATDRYSYPGLEEEKGWCHALSACIVWGEREEEKGLKAVTDLQLKMKLDYLTVVLCSDSKISFLEDKACFKLADWYGYHLYNLVSLKIYREGPGR